MLQGLEGRKALKMDIKKASNIVADLLYLSLDRMKPI